MGVGVEATAGAAVATATPDVATAVATMGAGAAGAAAAVPASECSASAMCAAVGGTAVAEGIGVCRAWVPRRVEGTAEWGWGGVCRGRRSLSAPACTHLRREGWAAMEARSTGTLRVREQFQLSGGCRRQCGATSVIALCLATTVCDSA